MYLKTDGSMLEAMLNIENVGLHKGPKHTAEPWYQALETPEGNLHVVNANF